jgi:hypothetical protein
MKCIMIGFYYQGDPIGAYQGRSLHKFVGNIDIDSRDPLGKFQGETQDEHGNAEIAGQISADVIKFVKIYDTESISLHGANKNPMAYTLIPFVFNGVILGWAGEWQDVFRNDHRGNILLSIIPNPEFPFG